MLGAYWDVFGTILGSFLNPAVCSVDPTMSKPCVAGAGTTLPHTMLPREAAPLIEYHETQRMCTNGGRR